MTAGALDLVALLADVLALSTASFNALAARSPIPALVTGAFVALSLACQAASHFGWTP